MSVIKSMGTTLKKKKSGSEGADTTIGGLTSIGGLVIEAADIDVTDLDAVDQYRQFVQGNKDAGELALEGIIKSEAQVGVMAALMTSGSVETWEITYPSGAVWSFSAYVKAFGDTDKNTDDTVINFTATLKLSGKPSFTSGASV